MSSLQFSIIHLLFYSILIIRSEIISPTTINYFTQSNYELWCQENVRFGSLLLYPNRIPMGIRRTTTIKHLNYNLIDNHGDLFTIKTKRLGDFYFLLLNITRPFDINREYQDVYTLHVQANIFTSHDNRTEQAQIRLHVADSNDNDGVFDMDIYEQNFSYPIDDYQKALIRFHASDADEIQNAQIIYEMASSPPNDTFSLHPFTGELFFTGPNTDRLENLYQFEIFAYDRHRKRGGYENMNTKARVRLRFNKREEEKFDNVTTITNETIRFRSLIESYAIGIDETKNWNFHNAHRPLISVRILNDSQLVFELFLLNSSSPNVIDLFIDRQSIYVNRPILAEYRLHFLICFFHRTQCQHSNYRYIPTIDFNSFQLSFPIQQQQKPIELEENLPIDSFVTRILLRQPIEIDIHLLTIHYRLLNDDELIQFYIDKQTGIIRLAERLQPINYTLDIQADIRLINRRYSIETTIDICVRDINKYRPKFIHEIPREVFQLPYQFQAIDFDRNKETNGRITYQLTSCDTMNQSCPFRIDPDNGTLILRTKPTMNIFNLTIVAFDWGRPVSLETSINVRIHLNPNRFIVKRDARTRAYARRWRKKSTTTPALAFLNTTSSNLLSNSTSSSTIDTLLLDMGFSQNSKSYHLAEDTRLDFILDQFKIENDDDDNAFFFTINDTSIPFAVDQQDRTLKLISTLDREREDRYEFEIGLKLKSTYALKFQSRCQNQSSPVNVQYTDRYFQKLHIVIHIDDVNDHSPMCERFHARIEIEENQVRRNIFRVQAHDPDLGENGTIDYALLGYEQHFFIDSRTGQIDLIRPFDREENPFVLIHIVASDRGRQPQLQSICMTLHILILDINDHIPQFISNPFHFYLFADMSRYAVFGQIYATDRDEISSLNYSLDPNPYLHINGQTGHLRLKNSLHRLVDQIMNVTVTVNDGQHTNRTTIYIHIQPIILAQQPILIHEPGYGVIINESMPIGSIVSNVFRRILTETNIDNVELHTEDNTMSPFDIDQQGIIRLVRPLTGLSRSSYWLAVRLTRLRARPPHSFVHVHISVRQENLYLPQCSHVYQTVNAYEYSLPVPFARVQASTPHSSNTLQYAIVEGDPTGKVFAIDSRTGFVRLLSSADPRRQQSDYLLTIRASDNQQSLSVDCWLRVFVIRRRDLTPKFYLYHNNTSIYNIDLPEIERQSGRLRQRLFQVVALLNDRVQDHKLETRYRLIDPTQHFVINRETGYLAAKKPLQTHNIYEFNIEAFTVAHRDDLLPGGGDDDEEHPGRGKWRLVSLRVILPVKVRVLPPVLTMDSSSLPTTIKIDLLTNTRIGSSLVRLATNNGTETNQQWFIMTGDIRHTRHFHVDFQFGELILIRSVKELDNETTIELRIEATHDWIHMHTIQVIVRIVNSTIPLQPSLEFAQTDYYTAVSQSVPLGVEIARLTIDNGSNDCRYSIHSVERLKSDGLFRIDPHTGSLTVVRPLQTSIGRSHLLSIIYRCSLDRTMASTRLHITILDEQSLRNDENSTHYRFVEQNYVVIFETTLVVNQTRNLIDFELNTNENNQRKKPEAKIISGDPLGLFAIDPLNQSLVLTDQSRSRSYTYPIELTIVDLISSVNCSVTIFISNIAVQFNCPAFRFSPYLYTFESIPTANVDPLTGQHFHPRSLTIRAFDPMTPSNGEASNQAECFINYASSNSSATLTNTSEIVFEQEFYHGQVNDSFGSSSFIYPINNNDQPLRLQTTNIYNPFEISYRFLNQTDIDWFQLDSHAAIIKHIRTRPSIGNALSRFSFLVLAQYRTSISFARVILTVQHDNRTTKLITNFLQSIYEFKLIIPFVDNFTIGYLNMTTISDEYLKFTILNELMLPLVAIDHRGRLSVRNRDLLLSTANFYDFLVQFDSDQPASVARIQITLVQPRESVACSLMKFDRIHDRQLIGFVRVNGTSPSCEQRRIPLFNLLNYHELFRLDREHGLLLRQDPHSINTLDRLLLVQINDARCLVTVDEPSRSSAYLMIRNGSHLEWEIDEKHQPIDRENPQIKLANGTLIDIDIVDRYAPLFSQRSYSFSVNSSTNNSTIIVGQISASPIDPNRSQIVYQLVNINPYFDINLDNGWILFYPESSFNITEEHFQIVARDLIFQQNTTVNITVYINRPKSLTFSSPIYYRTLSEVLPPGSILLQVNISSPSNDIRYSLHDHDVNLFEIDSITGIIRLLDWFHCEIRSFYSFRIRASPIAEMALVEFDIQDYNNHPPRFINFPSNLTFSPRQSFFVTKLSANDLDRDDYERLTYRILEQQPQILFQIDSHTGVITMNDDKETFDNDHFELNIAVSDGWYVSSHLLQIQIENFHQHAPIFDREEYILTYRIENSRTIAIGQVHASDADRNDRIFYRIYLAPDGIEINPNSGTITLDYRLFSPLSSEPLDMYVSAMDRASQYAYARLRLLVEIHPMFSSDLFYVTLIRPIRAYSSVFNFYLVDAFNRRLSGTRFEVDSPSSWFEIRPYSSELITRQDLIESTNNYELHIRGLWKNETVYSRIRVTIVEQLDETMKFDRDLYEFRMLDTIEKGDILGTCGIMNEHIDYRLISSPLTRNNCSENFRLNQCQLIFHQQPILSRLCFFQIQISSRTMTVTSQIEVITIDRNLIRPHFSSSIYDFHLDRVRDDAHYQRLFRLFASPGNIRFEIEPNQMGMILNQTNGWISLKHGTMKTFDRIELPVYAIDEQTHLNDTALINIIFDRKNRFQIPANNADVSICANRPIPLVEQSLPGTIIQDIDIDDGHRNRYYIVSGNEYGLFAINDFGQLYLISTMLNTTSEEDFDLLILISSSSSVITYCRTKISIVRSPKWSYFVCPTIPLHWTVEEESPVGTAIGSVLDTLWLANNFSRNRELIKELSFRLTNNDDARTFRIDQQTGTITSLARLDYEQQSNYAFSVLLEPNQLNCSLSISIQLINIDDNPIRFDPDSLNYTIDENHPIPIYLGRLRLIDLDRRSSLFDFDLHNRTSSIRIDRSTGSIIVLEQFDRETNGASLQWQVSASDARQNISGMLIFNINDVNDHGATFDKDLYETNVSKSIRPGTVILQLVASSRDPIANGNITYRLLDASPYVSLNATTGDIRLIRSIPSTLDRLIFSVEAREDGINTTDRASVHVSIVNDDNAYFDLNEIDKCTIDENQPIGTTICSLGRLTGGLIYELIDPSDSFAIQSNNGTVISRRIFDYETDGHQSNVTIVARDDDNQSFPLSSLDIVIRLRNLNDNRPQFIPNNRTTLIFFSYPSVDSVLYQIEAIDKDATPLTYEIVNGSADYALRSSSNVVLIRPILADRHDELLIRVWDNSTIDDVQHYADMKLTLIFNQQPIEMPKIDLQTIDGYIDHFQQQSSLINLGPLFVQNHSVYSFVQFDLLKDIQNISSVFSLDRRTINHTELVFNTKLGLPRHAARSMQFTIDLMAIAVRESIPAANDSTNVIIVQPISSPLHSIGIHLWSIDREMLDRTLSLTIRLVSSSTIDQFLDDSLPTFRRTFAQLIGVHLRHVHIYGIQTKENHRIEILLAIIRYPSRMRPPRFIHKKLLYNALRNHTHLFQSLRHIDAIEHLNINQCHTNSCDNNGRCTSQIRLIPDQYEYYRYNSSHGRLMPKYEWVMKCLCSKHFYGNRCEYRQQFESPCLSNPCSANERCIDENARLYTCECIDEPCNMNNEIPIGSILDCININSPTCRDSSNTLTFDGYSFVRWNLTMNITRTLNVSLTFRTQVAQGKLIKIIWPNGQESNSLIIQIVHGRLQVEFNGQNVLRIDQISVHDGLWHDVFFAMDSSLIAQQLLLLIRLDQVFSDATSVSSVVDSHLIEWIIGTDLHGCLGNITLNNRSILLQRQQEQQQKELGFIEHIGTNDGCQLPELETRTLREFNVKNEDICSLYHPCYHGGTCNSGHGLTFSCSCLKPRFAGRQCQRDLQPCESRPCAFNERCVPGSSWSSFSCVSSLTALAMSSDSMVGGKGPLYIVLAVTFCTLLLLSILFAALIVHCRQQQRQQRTKTITIDKPLVSAPLLINKSSPTAGLESPMQTLLKLNHTNGRSTNTVPANDDTSTSPATMNNFNEKSNQLNKSSASIDKQQYQSGESLNRRRSDPKYYSTIGRMNIPPDNFLTHYNTIDHDGTCIPLVDSTATTDPFDFSPSPTKYFNGVNGGGGDHHHPSAATTYQVRINSFSSLTEQLAEQNDIELTHSSNDSSSNTNEQTLLTSPTIHSSISKPPVYAKVMKTAKTNNGGLSTIERLRLSGSPLRLLSSSPNYARTTSFIKPSSPSIHPPVDVDKILFDSSTKNNKMNTSWKLNPRKLDSLKVRRNSRQMDDDEDDDNNNNNNNNNGETSQLTSSSRARHASDSDLTGKKVTKMSSFFQTEV